jgi:hypothetical protein
MPVDAGLGGGAVGFAGADAAERTTHALEDSLARGPAVVDGGRRRCDAVAAPLRTSVSRRSMLRSIASFETAYEKRMCRPSPGTRLPKRMSASGTDTDVRGFARKLTILRDRRPRDELKSGRTDKTPRRRAHRLP